MKSKLNNSNQEFYSTYKDPFATSGIADLFINGSQIHNALRKHIESLCPTQDIKVLELASGSGSKRWKTIAANSSRSWEVTLSDFSTNVFDTRKEERALTNLVLRATLIDLLKPLRLEASHKALKNRFDVIIATYGFDSIWAKHDVHIKNTLTIAQKTNPYANEILDYYKDLKGRAFNFPGGMLAKIKEAFSLLLKPQGVFVSADVAFVNKIDSLNTGSLFNKTHFLSGKHALFKAEDYGVAEFILNKCGFKTSTTTLNDFLAMYNEEIPLNLSDHCVITVQKAV